MDAQHRPIKNVCTCEPGDIDENAHKPISCNGEKTKLELSNRKIEVIK